MEERRGERIAPSMACKLHVCRLPCPAPHPTPALIFKDCVFFPGMKWA